MAAVAASISLNIVALRDDLSAGVEWLDMGFASTTAWESEKSEVPTPSHGMRKQRTYRRTVRPAESMTSEATDAEPAAVERAKSLWRRPKSRSPCCRLVAAEDSEEASMGATESKKSMTSAPSTPLMKRHVTKGRRSARRYMSNPCIEASEESSLASADFISDVETCTPSSAASEVDHMSSYGSGSSCASSAEEEEEVPPVPQVEMPAQRWSTGRCCRQCNETYSGFGDMCGSCRKAGPRGTARQCVRCSHFFSGFGAFCEDCDSCTRC